METIMSKFRSHSVRFTPLSQISDSQCVCTQVAAQQHQANLTEHYDTLLAREPSPPSESAANQNMNQSLHRLSQALQAALLSLTGQDPAESLSEDANINADEGDSDQLPGARPPSKPREGEGQASDAPLLQPQPGLAESPQPNTAASHSAQVESDPQAQPSGSEPSLSHDGAVDVVPATATATADAATTATTTITTTPANPTRTGSRDPSPTTRSETADAQPDIDWSEVREDEIARLESENAHLRALLGIDPSGLATAGIPDIDPEPPFVTSSFHGAPHPSAAGSSAWANASAETANPFTHGFRGEDPSVLGLAATSGRLHTLTPPNAPHAIMTANTSASATPNTAGGTPLTGRGAGVFVSASWGASPANGNGNGAGAGMGPGQVGVPQLQQQRSSPPPLGIAGLARMELQGPGIGVPNSGPGGAGRGRGVLFGGRGRSVGW